MIKRSVLAVLILTAGSLCTLSASDRAVEHPNRYNLMLKPDGDPRSCHMEVHEILQDFSLAGLTASKHHSYCLEKYIKCIHFHGSRKSGPSMTQCGAWKDQCDAQGVWSGPPYLFTDEGKKDEL